MLQSQMVPWSILHPHLLILHDRGFTGSKFHSSSLRRSHYKQELAGNTIAPRRCDLLWGKLRLIMIERSGFLVSWGQTLCSQSARNGFMSQTKIEWFMQRTLCSYRDIWCPTQQQYQKKKKKMTLSFQETRLSSMHCQANTRAPTVEAFLAEVLPVLQMPPRWYVMTPGLINLRSPYAVSKWDAIISEISTLL